MKQYNKSLVSVIMPVHNAAGFLVEAIESIRSQTHTNWELICVDDASTDGTYWILEQYKHKDKRIKVLRNTRKKGIGHSLNKTLEHAKGEFIARMDADDISLSQRFEKQLELLANNPRVAACGGQAAMIDMHSNIFAYKKFSTKNEDLYRIIMEMVPIQHPILMARASAMKKYRYLENLKTAEDVDLLFYLLSCGDLSNVSTVIYKYRKADTSNGYHNVKKTFLITFTSRFQAIVKYGYKPTFAGILITICQFLLVSCLPSKWVVKIFEAFRLDPPIWQRPFRSFYKIFLLRFSPVTTQ